MNNIATDAEGNQGNYEHTEDMQVSYLLAASSKSDHTWYLGTEVFHFHWTFCFILDVAVLGEDKP